jgi:hypothetical protein
LAQFITLAVQSAHEKDTETKPFLDAVQKMAADSNAPAEIQELGKVLQHILIGNLDLENIDLTGLPPNLAEMVRQALEKKQ